MERENNAANEENADNVSVTTRLLSQPEEEPSAYITIPPSAAQSDDPTKMDSSTLSKEECEYHKDLVDVSGGTGDFAWVSQSGLPVLSQTENERELNKYDSEIPSITKQISMNGEQRPSLANVELFRETSIKLNVKHGLQGLSENKKHLVGLFLILIYCFTLVGGNQFAKASYSKSFSAPFLLVYLRTSLRMSIFPVFMVLKHIHRLVRHKGDGGGPVSFWKTYTSCQAVFGSQGLTLRTFFYPFGLLASLWLVTQFTHVFAVKFINNSIVQALMCADTAFCYLLSALILKAPVYILKVSAVVVALAGVSLMVFSQASDLLRWEGVVISLSGAVMGSLYMVFVKKALGKSEDVGQALLLTSVMALFVTLIYWPVVIILYYTGVEFWNLETFPWEAVGISSTMTLASISVFNLALTLTSPLLMTLGKLLGLPVNFGIDAIFWDHQFDLYQIFGVILIGLGFVCIALPERWLAIDFLAPKFRRHTAITSRASAIPVMTSKETLGYM